MSRGALIEEQLRDDRRAIGEETRAIDPSASEPGGWIERRPGRAFLVLSVLYLVAVFVLSSFKLLWLDELITLHIARLPSVHAIWAALAAGADPNPPIIHILVHLSRAAFGEHAFALRLPAVIGYWIGMTSLFCYLRRRVPATWAIGGTLLSMCMAAFDYSYESRSYAIFYGLAMLAFFSWSRSVSPMRTPRERGTALFFMVLALALGVSTNYFAVLAFFPIAAGELVRTASRVYGANRKDRSLHIESGGSFFRSVDLRVWLGLLLGALPLLAFRHMIAHSIAQFAPYAWNKVSWQKVTDSYTEMVEIVLYPLLVLMGLCIVMLVLARLCAACRSALRPRWIGRLATRVERSEAVLPPSEAAGVFALMVYPILGYVIASIRGGMLSSRFVIPVCFGFAIAGTLAIFRVFGSMRYAGTAFVCITLAWFLARESVVGYWYSEQKQCFYKVLAHLPEAEIPGEPQAPIVIPDPLLALTFQHYAPPSLAAREVFPVDFPAIRKYRGDDSAEENLWAGRSSIYTLPIVTMAKFQHGAGDYLIIASDGNWMITDLRDHRYPAQRLDINTRAGAIGGFTPLCHGVPVFFTGAGDAVLNSTSLTGDGPVPFVASDNVPTAATEATEDRSKP